jgi:retron-type reverse transcriptase
MVDVLKLRARMVLKGYNQKRLVEALNAHGIKINENTLSSKMNGKPFDTDLVDGICDILEIEEPAEKAEIFLA